MANRLAMEVAGGLSSVDPSAILGSIDPRNVHVGAEHTPTGQTYNRKALPWEGAAYTRVGGSWVKIAGRPDAATGEEIEKQYPNLAQVWQQFDKAQDARASDPGNFDALVADLRRVAQNIGSPGRMDAELGEGTSLRAIKQRSSQGNA